MKRGVTASPVEERIASAVWVHRCANGRRRRWLAERVDQASPERLLDLRRGLEELTRQDAGEPVTWIVRQIALPAPRITDRRTRRR